MTRDIKVYLADKAKELTTGPRRVDYGPPEKNFQRIAEFWNAYLKARGLFGAMDRLIPTDIAALMRLMKEARLIETPDHLDSYADLVGYTLTGAEVAGVDVPITLPKAKDGPLL